MYQLWDPLKGPDPLVKNLGLTGYIHSDIIVDLEILIVCSCIVLEISSVTRHCNVIH